MSAGGSFDLGDAGDLKAAIADAGGTLSITELTPGSRFGRGLSRTFRRRELEGGKFCVFNQKDNYGIIVYFKPDEVETCSVSIDERNNRARLSIQGKLITYTKGEQAGLNYSLEFNNSISQMID